MMPPQQQSKRERTRDQILIAAQELLMETSAASLGIRQVAERAGLVHASFYNYYADIEALLDGLAELLVATHALAVAPAREGIVDHVALFAATTRQTLRLIPDSPRFARLLFDSGIPVDRLLRALHEPLRADIRMGAKAGALSVQNTDLAVTMIAGAMMGMAVDLYRRRARSNAIDDMTFQLLRLLGVSPARAKAAATAPLSHIAPPPIPLTWKAIGLTAPEANHAA